ncbi:MAG: hypothetical protein ICV84_06775, partial [Flavisolibacter sp.]|nr:hypothetical protein [Flavisolibacter sp.]
MRKLFFILLLLPLFSSAQVSISDYAGNYRQISNGWCGVIVPKQGTIQGTLGNSNAVMAPIQAVIYHDGTVSNSGVGNVTLKYPFFSASGWSVSVDENVTTDRTGTISFTQSSSKRTIRIAYSFTKEAFNYGNGYDRTGASYASKGGGAGPGYLDMYVTMETGAKSAQVIWDTNYDLYFDIPLSNGLNPNRLRYSGHSAQDVCTLFSSQCWPQSQNGYEIVNGQKIPYRREEGRLPSDATIDWSPGNGNREFQAMHLWPGYMPSTGFYWMMYNTGGGNVFGMYHGRPSLIYGSNETGPCFRFLNGQSYMTFWSKRRSDDNNFVEKIRQEVGLWMSNTSDVNDPQQYQPIAVDYNYYGHRLGSKVDNWYNNPSDVADYFNAAAFYRSASEMQDFISKLKNNAGYYSKMAEADTYFEQHIGTYIRNGNEQQLIQELLNKCEYVRQAFKTGNGIADWNNQMGRIRGFEGPTNWKKYSIQFAMLLADPGKNIPADQKDKLYRYMSMLAHIAKDQDFAPNRVQMADPTRIFIGFGTPNMPIQLKANQDYWTMIYAQKNAEYAGLASTIYQESLSQLDNLINPDGSSIGTTHYLAADLSGALYNTLQVKQAGLGDIATALQPKLRKLADFTFNFGTPKHPGFGNQRFMDPQEDSPIEMNAYVPLLAQVLKAFDGQLSDEMYAFAQSGNEHGDFEFGYESMAVDWTIKNNDFTRHLKNVSFPLYYSAARFAPNTNNETYTRLIAGNGWYDHRLGNTQNQSSLYALSAPISYFWTSMYNPHPYHPGLKNIMMPANMLPDWNSTSPLGEWSWQTAWGGSTMQEYGKGLFSSIARGLATGVTQWERKMITVAPDAARPVIILRDNVGNGGNNVYTQTLFADGAVGTPAGSITPPSPSGGWPVSSGTYSLSAGANEFNFTGTSMAGHPNGGINFKVLSILPSGGQFVLSNWSAGERQYILRVKASGTMTHIYLPYNKGQGDPYNGYSYSSGKLTLPYGGATMVVSDDGYYYSSDTMTVVSSFGSAGWNHNSYNIVGGIAEIHRQGDKIKIRVHGNSGTRKVTVPFIAKLVSDQQGVSVTTSNNQTEVTISYINNQVALTSAEQGYTEIVLTTDMNNVVAPPSAPTVSVSQPTLEVATGTITVTAPVGSGITYSINGT